jgi:large subunit ribosomal protein L17
MRNRNKVKQLGRTKAHRKAMFNNMVTSLFLHERIVTTKQKGKQLKVISEKLITKAKKNLLLNDSDSEMKLHNKREVLKVIKNRDVVAKLFDNIASRFAERKGGYTRLYHLGRRAGDAAEMAIVELVVREKVEIKKTENEKEDSKKSKDKKKIKEDKKVVSDKEDSKKSKEKKKDKKDKEDK